MCKCVTAAETGKWQRRKLENHHLLRNIRIYNCLHLSNWQYFLHPWHLCLSIFVSYPFLITKITIIRIVVQPDVSHEILHTNLCPCHYHHNHHHNCHHHHQNAHAYVDRRMFPTKSCVRRRDVRQALLLRQGGPGITVIVKTIMATMATMSLPR